MTDTAQHARSHNDNDDNDATDAAAAEAASEPALDPMLTTTEVAELFRVSVKTVGRWGRSGALPLYRTIGGHHRYRAADICAFLGLDPTTLARG
jgi:excisionase family DNA binding protein